MVELIFPGSAQRGRRWPVTCVYKHVTNVWHWSLDHWSPSSCKCKKLAHSSLQRNHCKQNQTDHIFIIRFLVHGKVDYPKIFQCFCFEIHFKKNPTVLLNICRQFIWDPGIVMSVIAVGLSKELWIFWEFPVLMAGNNGDWLARISDIPTKLRREIRLTRGWERYFSPRTTIYHQSIYFRYYSVTWVQLFHDL